MGALTVLHPFAARAQANQAHLRIMETTDLHCHVMPYDYLPIAPITRWASLVLQA
ncbi:hypothetical protein GCM10010136_04250 [Limoniibacter endophyticus]|uniref:Uncharacterized protein n=1 Tax=Limoniibacter endophyticus TaxID=1565040 RepID=A0A8J3DG00_9HYPH|nr:hypothetical protein GCM10010136_04250 [Limoniibacter endophyticus]